MTEQEQYEAMRKQDRTMRHNAMECWQMPSRFKQSSTVQIAGELHGATLQIWSQIGGAVVPIADGGPFSDSFCDQFGMLVRRIVVQGTCDAILVELKGADTKTKIEVGVR